MRTWTRTNKQILAVGILAFLVGCGSDLESALYQTATAVGQTWLDQLLTDVANSAADAFEQDADDAPGDLVDDDDGDGDGDDGDDDDGDDDNDDGDGDGGSTGDPAAGEPLYASCTACHCPDAIGDCFPGAPALVGANAATLGAFLDGAETHTGGESDLAEQEILDLEAYLGSLGGPTGDPAAGEALFASCMACHCEDASGGCFPEAPALVGVGPDTLELTVIGEAEHTGGKFDFTHDDIADLEAFLEAF